MPDGEFDWGGRLRKGIGVKVMLWMKTLMIKKIKKFK